jgi:4-amino-4-deoxy-L-arabinose transferase-like glycosyltransferase
MDTSLDPSAGSVSGERTQVFGARKRLTFRLALLATVLLVAAERLWNLDRVPGELYGDIAIVYEYVAGILAGRWPVQFVLSAGPLYHYLILPIAWLTHSSYFGLKLASVAVSLGVLGALYALARELLDEELALLALFVGGVSSWLLIFSRLGNSQILVPLLSTGALFFAIRLARGGRDMDAAACAFVAALGLYTYPQTFILPPVILVVLLYLLWARTAVRYAHLRLFALVTLACALPFIAIIASDPENFFGGYIGGKLRPEGGLVKTLFGNIARGLLAFNVRGDEVFRSNPAALPHLDRISGILFLVGIVFWLLPGRRRWGLALLASFLALQAPSMLVLAAPREVPSASRSIAVAPLAYLFVASGLWWLGGLRQRLPGQVWLVRLLLLAAILVANTRRYFDVYVAGLPDHNLPFGRVIAEFVDRLPPSTTVYMVGCCWGSWSQPEPKGVRYVTRRPQSLRQIDAKDLTCELIASAPRPSVIIWSPYDPLPAPRLARCARQFATPRIHSERGVLIFQYATLAAAAGQPSGTPR